MGGTDSGQIRLLIADDHELVRDLVAAHLRAQGQFDVVTVESFSAAGDAVRAEGPFDLVLLDFSMPGMDGVEGIAELRARNGGRPVALFSGQARRETVLEALRRGAAGYIPKSTAPRDLPGVIRRILAGEAYLPADFDAPAPLPQGGFGLTPRELQVLRALREGLMNKEIAGQMGLSEVTIKMHVRSICTKLNARNRTQAAMIAEGNNIG